MSRSIHATKRNIIRATKWKFTDPEKEDALVRPLLVGYYKKRNVKKSVRWNRKTSQVQFEFTDPDTIPITITDEGEHVHYPATVEDIQNIMGLLPKGVLDNLMGVEFVLGKLKTPEDEENSQPDPYTGRYGNEFIENTGIYIGECFGEYIFPYLRQNYPDQLKEMLAGIEKMK
jgi:hypothetical protein